MWSPTSLSIYTPRIACYHPAKLGVASTFIQGLARVRAGAPVFDMSGVASASSNRWPYAGTALLREINREFIR